MRADNWYGHTLITGNVGTGKTTLLRLLSCGAIHHGNVVLAVDPKNDQDWRDAMKAECDALRDPLLLIPSVPCLVLCGPLTRCETTPETLKSPHG